MQGRNMQMCFDNTDIAVAKWGSYTKLNIWKVQIYLKKRAKQLQCCEMSTQYTVCQNLILTMGKHL